jgi:alkanesulfonate monooxygenase SsuD/methylene tetrahydromethanopterin reductase-like flavin-dependent oxidoreductase (luciferase family)
MDAAGIAFEAAGQRIARLDESLAIIRGLLAGTPVHQASGFYRIDGLDLDVLPTPRPDAPRLLVGAGGPRMLSAPVPIQIPGGSPVALR